MTVYKCTDCGAEVSRNAKYRAEVRCMACARANQRARTAQRQADKIEDAEWIVNTGGSWWEAVRRVDTTIHGMAKLYERNGMSVPAGLGGILSELKVDKRRKGECEACGGETWTPKVTLCHVCRYALNRVEVAA